MENNYTLFSAKRGSLYFLLNHFGSVFSRQILSVRSVKAWKLDVNNSELYPV